MKHLTLCLKESYKKEDCFRKGLALLSDALSNLTPQQREIFQLKEKDNLTLESIAKLKKITRQAADPKLFLLDGAAFSELRYNFGIK